MVARVVPRYKAKETRGTSTASGKEPLSVVRKRDVFGQHMGWRKSKGKRGGAFGGKERPFQPTAEGEKAFQPPQENQKEKKGLNLWPRKNLLNKKD